MRNNNQGQIKTIVLDIDGTITKEGDLVSPETINILGKICIQNHLSLVFLTGRAFCLVKYIIDEFHNQFGDISFIKGVLSELGTRFTNNHGEEIWVRYLDIDTKSTLLKFLSPKKMFLFHGEKNGYYLYSDQESVLLSWEQKFSKYGSQMFYLKSNDYKFLINLFLLDQKVSIIRTGSKLPKNCILDTTYNPKHNLWELSPLQSKKNGLIRYAIENNLSTRSILFAGNEPADHSVFELNLGLSVYVGENSLESLDYSLKYPSELLSLLQILFPIK